MNAYLQYIPDARRGGTGKHLGSGAHKLWYPSLKAAVSAASSSPSVIDGVPVFAEITDSDHVIRRTVDCQGRVRT